MPLDCALVIVHLGGEAAVLIILLLVVQNVCAGDPAAERSLCIL